MTTLPDYGLALDIETEGLDPDQHLVLEACAVLVRMNGAHYAEEVARVHVLLNEASVIDLKRIQSWDEPVRVMHRESGLLADIADPSGSGIDLTNLTGFEHRVLRMLDAHDLPYEDKLPTFGYGVGHMEAKGWVQNRWPGIYRRLTYWPVDVSTLRRSLEYFGFELPPKGDRHRADKDCESAMAEWAFIGDRMTMQLPLDWFDNAGRPATDRS